MKVNHSYILFGISLAALVICFNSSTAQSPDCATMYKCNATDANCNVIGGRCKQDYRMCCDKVCHYEQEPCQNFTSEYTNQNYSQYVRNLNTSEYLNELERAKQKIIAWAKERPCWPEEKCLNKTSCLPQYQHCNNGECTELLSDCGFWWEKSDYTQRNNTTCYPDEHCFRTNCKTGYWMCDDGECVNEQVVCRGGTDCSDGSDETRCDGSCFPPFRCSNDSCKDGFFRCENGKCILQEQICDTIADCNDGSDEFNCSGSCWPKTNCNDDGKCKPGYFNCDGDKCIADVNVCDQRANCKDGSDEIRQGHGFKCVLGQNFDTCVLPQIMVHETTAICIDFSDECNVNGTDRCFTCLDQKVIIADKQRCNGVIDCFDMSDECLCFDSVAESACQSLSLHINSNETSTRSQLLSKNQYFPAINSCPPGQFDCGNDICLNKSQVCNGIPECGDSQADEIYCESILRRNEKKIFCPGDITNSTQIEAVLCDGRPECHDLSDECGGQCNTTALFCNIKSLFNSMSGPYEYLCDKKALYFDVKHICDGKWTLCNPQIDEEELDCPARYYCKNGDAISIDINLVCDGIPQCEDKSDEINCSDRFYCENRIPFSIPLLNKLDGKRDCSDFSDECPKDMDNNVMSSRRELLGAVGFRVTTWIIGAFATIGNVVTFIVTIKSLRTAKCLNPVTKIHYVLFINLSLADCLMGIYLLTLSVKSVEFSGNYCKYDKLWRTSATCSGIGSLALTSSQASVLILTFLTTLRLYSIRNPIKIKQLSVKLPIVGLIFAWIISIVIGVLPRSSHLTDYFVSDVYMPTNFTNLDVRGKESMIAFVHRLAAVKPVSQPPPTETSWLAMAQYLKKNYGDIEIKGFFGYFSDNSVCLPKFFASVGETGWGYSAGIIVFNFLAFVYVCFAYWIIFRITRQRQGNKQRAKRMKEIQGRVARLVITDFCCWVPICLISFIQLGGINVPDMAYAVSALILLPINSALNPLLYSDITVAKVIRLFRKLFNSQKTDESASDSTGLRPGQSKRNQSNNELDGQRSAVTEEKTV